MAKLSNGDALMQQVLDGSLSGPCQHDMQNLLKMGASATGIINAAETTNWNDATGDKDLVLGTDVPGTADYANQLLHGPNETIGHYTNPGSGTGAVSALPGSALWGNIYFSAHYVNGLTLQMTAALLMHELIHTLGFTDTQIQGALFGANSPQVGQLSGNITTQLNTDCFQGVKPQF